jgi:hypothetical protein
MVKIQRGSTLGKILFFYLIVIDVKGGERAMKNALSNLGGVVTV